jgi:predicted transcriptional regulator
MDKAIVATRIDNQTLRALRELAQRQDRTVSYLVRKAVEEFARAGNGDREPQRKEA